MGGGNTMTGGGAPGSRPYGWATKTTGIPIAATYPDCFCIAVLDKGLVCLPPKRISPPLRAKPA